MLPMAARSCYTRTVREDDKMPRREQKRVWLGAVGLKEERKTELQEAGESVLISPLRPQAKRGILEEGRDLPHSLSLVWV